MASSFKKMVFGKKQQEEGFELASKKVQDTSTAGSETSASEKSGSIPKNTHPNEAIDLEANAKQGSNSFGKF